MKTTRIDILSLDDPRMGQKLAQALGARPGDTMQVANPTFNRPTNWPDPAPTINFSTLNHLTGPELRNLGCHCWETRCGNTLWLFPHEWYDYIPEGLPIVDICYKLTTFKHGVSCDDKRFGMLAYGVLRPNVGPTP